MEILKVGGEIATWLVAIGTVAVICWKYGGKAFRWLRSWTLIKRHRLNRLKEIEVEYENFRRAKPKTAAVLESWFLKQPDLKIDLEFDRLKAIETEHQKCQTEKERLRKLDNPMAREIRAQIERSHERQEPKVNSESGPGGLFKDRK